jgi:hypothetical protein
MERELCRGNRRHDPDRDSPFLLTIRVEIYEHSESVSLPFHTQKLDRALSTIFRSTNVQDSVRHIIE